ncbi:Helix-turn-helix domain-containing protein [Halogranum gelatinilyticum]|uniref:Helix-turn-helix domain-containing protein n=1 Tax=Halogranum gelatinilyticum TaxID=660521 RepID=A0A1G9YT63_9EURY|nr:winged helix-turn-helix domain-containing protein [Halogranum gelatinilyticum]SDN11583.1 Helix-turn-helix domain-containing protein [Halogranum gelatinilyticum]
MSEDVDAAEVLRLLDDEYARAILTATSREPMSANDLTTAIDASPPTVYRRVDALMDAGLLDEELKYESSGHHYGVYRANVERVTVEFVDGEFELTVEAVEETAADRFTRLYEGLR